MSATYSQIVWKTSSHLSRERMTEQTGQMFTTVNLSKGCTGIFVLFLQLFYNLELF